MVAQYKSITKAAIELHTSQPALSKKITQLEEQLGLMLFIRGKNKELRPTPVGQLLISHWERLLNEFRAYLSTAEKIQESKSKRLLLVTTPSAEKNIFISPVVLAFRRVYPDIELRVECTGIVRAKDLLETGTADVLLVNSLHYDLFDMDNFNAQMVLTCPWSVGMLKSNPLSKKRSLTFADLRTQQFIVPQNNTFIGKITELCKAHGFAPSIAYYTRNFLCLSICICGSNEVYITDRYSQDYYDENCAYFDLPNTSSGVMMAVRRQNDNPLVDSFRHTALSVYQSLNLANKYTS